MGPLKIRKPSAILFDIIGTATKSHFIDQILFTYIRMNVKTYLENYWDNSVLQHDVKMMREQAKKDKPPGKIPEEGADPQSIRNAVAEYALKSLEELKDNEALTQFKFHILFDGYTKGGIETPVYTDVAIAIRHWAIDDNIQLYVFSNGWCEATKRYLQKTNHGDMNLLIAGHFDTKEGPLTDSATYKKVLKQVKHPAEDVLFLTHSGAEGRAAKKAGLSVVLIMTHRRDLTKLTPEEKKEMPYIRSFNELIFTGDAPKACQLDGSSVVDDDDDKDDKSNESAKPSSAASKSKASSKTTSSSSTAASKSSTDGSKSKSSSSAGLSNEFSGAKSKSAAASSKPKSNSSTGSSAKSSLTKASSNKSASSTSGTSAASKAKSKSKSQASNSSQASKSKSSPDAASKSKSSASTGSAANSAATGSKKSKTKSSSNGGAGGSSAGGSSAGGSSAGSKDSNAGGSSSGSKNGGANSSSQN